MHLIGSYNGERMIPKAFFLCLQHLLWLQMEGTARHEAKSRRNIKFEHHRPFERDLVRYAQQLAFISVFSNSSTFCYTFCSLLFQMSIYKASISLKRLNLIIVPPTWKASYAKYSELYNMSFLRAVRVLQAGRKKDRMMVTFYGTCWLRETFNFQHCDLQKKKRSWRAPLNEPKHYTTG